MAALNDDATLAKWGFESNYCFRCGKTNEDISGLLMQCGKCKKVYYCSMACFNADLPAHQKICGTAEFDNRDPCRMTATHSSMIPKCKDNTTEEIPKGKDSNAEEEVPKKKKKVKTVKKTVKKKKKGAKGAKKNAEKSKGNRGEDSVSADNVGDDGTRDFSKGEGKTFEDGGDGGEKVVLKSRESLEEKQKAEGSDGMSPPSEEIETHDDESSEYEDEDEDGRKRKSMGGGGVLGEGDDSLGPVGRNFNVGVDPGQADDEVRARHEALQLRQREKQLASTRAFSSRSVISSSSIAAETIHEEGEFAGETCNLENTICGPNGNCDDASSEYETDEDEDGPGRRSRGGGRASTVVDDGSDDLLQAQRRFTVDVDHVEADGEVHARTEEMLRQEREKRMLYSKTYSSLSNINVNGHKEGDPEWRKNKPVWAEKSLLKKGRSQRLLGVESEGDAHNESTAEDGKAGEEAREKKMREERGKKMLYSRAYSSLSKINVTEDREEPSWRANKPVWAQKPLLRKTEHAEKLRIPRGDPLSSSSMH